MPIIHISTVCFNSARHLGVAGCLERKITKGADMDNPLKKNEIRIQKHPPPPPPHRQRAFCARCVSSRPRPAK
jgi:hypothetical protein